MKITTEITDYSNPRKPNIRIHNHWNRGDYVELEIEDKRYAVKGSEIISAIKRCMLNECDQ